MSNKPNYSSLFYFNPLPSWVYDLNTFQILDVNQAAIVHYGYSKEEFTGLTLKDLRPKEEIPKLVDAHVDIDKKYGNIYFGIFTHQKKNGDLIRMKINGHKVDYLDTASMLVVCQDVTQEEEQLEALKSSEEALRESEAKFRTIFEIATLGIAQVDPSDGQILLVNSFYETITGYTIEELLNMSFVELTHPDDRERDWEVFSKAVRGEAEYRHEKRYVRKDGSIVWVRIHLAFIRDKHGEAYRTVAICEDITPEKKLRELNRTTSELARIGSWEMDFINQTDENVYWSPMTREILEVDDHQKPSLIDGFEFYSEESKQRIQNAVEVLIKEGKEFDEELLLTTVKGNEKWVRTLGKSERVNGKCVKIFGSIQDIHDSKSLEIQIREILGSISDAFYALNSNWEFTYFNKEAEKLLGSTDSEVIGKNLWDIFPKLNNTPIEEVYNRVVKTGQPESFEYKRRTDNKWYEINVYPFSGGISVYLKNIHERKQAAEKLVKANERFEKVTEATNDAIWDYDVLNHHLFWGKGFDSLFGYDPDVITPSFELWSSLIHEDDREQIINQMNQYFSDPNLKDWNQEYRFLKADNTYAFVIDRATFLRDSDGKLVRVIGAMADISQRKHFEQQLLQLNTSLKKHAHQLEITNAELEQFAFIASHDLQEPLRMISSFMELLKRKYGNQLDEKALQYVHFATDGAKRMKKIILDLLEYSRAGKFSEETEMVDLNEIVENYQILRRKIIHEKSVDISVNKLPELESHKAPLTQTIHCLLDNAIYYSKDGQTPHISVSTKDLGDNWEIRIADNGIGIDPQFHEKIFIIFQRLHHRDEYEGTGIGLSIVKKNVESWGGKIWLDSKPGEGARFYFTIPK